MFPRRVVSPGAGPTPAVRRWTQAAAAALLLTALPLTPPITPQAAADDCPFAEVVFARGTDEPAGMGRVGDALVDALRQQTGGMTIRPYPVNYKATITQRHSGEGAKDAIAHIKSTIAECPDTKIVLGGYSQGASVVNIVAGFNGVNWGDPLPVQYMKNVAAVATFGNVAGRTGGATPTQNSPLSAKAIDLCNPSDPICHAGPGNDWTGHTEGYVPEYTDQAAAFVAAALLAGVDHGPPDHGPPGYGPLLPSYAPPQQLPGYSPQTDVGPTLPGPVPTVPSAPGARYGGGFI